MLGYMVAVLKEVLAREDFNDVQVYFYTYDEAIHEYDFTGQEAERTILDPSIKGNYSRGSENYLADIRVYFS